MPLADIETILGQAMGLKISTIGEATLERAIKRRLKVLGLDNQETYILRLKTSLHEVKELIEEVVIPETWFFRNKAPFLALTDFVHKKWAINSKKQTLRILSAPCSTGEEPYSIAMTLLHGGWPENRFHIDALDISSRALSHAKEAEYNDYSFREKDFNYCYNYFTKTDDDKYKLKERVRKKVSFFQGNLLNPNFTGSLGLYDIIFCRNLLIYLDPRSQHKAIKTLDQLLDPIGLLFIGHAEAGVFGIDHFVGAPFPKAFAFHKVGAAHLFNDPSPTPQQDTLLWAPPKDPKSQPSTFSRGFAPQQIKGSKNIDLAHARKLVDQGNTNEAAKICEENIHINGPTAPSYFLLGIISDLEKEPERGIKFLRKAVYLDPDHWEALFLLSMLLERTGNEKEAGNIRRRADRARSRLKNDPAASA
ncbi:MAG: hypothetical protein KKE17_02210 [Proteobacteria bacterium]|nr:hypothetical protein [Pseudomonadota bacterium]MBU1708794.1 hypothetical protein [Pseudomonadota bacterium]